MPRSRCANSDNTTHLPNGCDCPQRVRIKSNSATVSSTRPTQTHQRTICASKKTASKMILAACMGVFVSRDVDRNRKVGNACLLARGQHVGDSLECRRA